MNILEILNTVVSIPQWYLVAVGVAGVVVSASVFTLVGWMFRRGRSLPKAKVVDGNRVVAPPVPVPVKNEKAPVIAYVSIKKRTPLPPLPPPPAVAAVKRKPVPPIRQHYWYTVDGSEDRYTTLLDTLQAIGYPLLKGDSPEWSKLPGDIRARIHREKFVPRKAGK